MTYKDYLNKKRREHINSGFEVEALPDTLFPFQQFCVRRALKAGRYALFTGTGTGKTRMQLTWGSEVNKHTGGMVLILCPLAVAEQTIDEGKKLNIEVVKYDGLSKIQITNYEQIDNIDPSLFSGVILDESSCIKDFQSATRNKIIESFAATPYKLSCSATPSPNDPMELGNQAEFLNVLSRNEMLAMYFVHDGGETSKWRLKGHAKKIFWQWVSTWAVVFDHPKRIGFDMDGYNLPELNIIEKKIVTAKRENGLLLNSTAVSATNFNAELRMTKYERLKIAAGIVNERKEIFLIWVKQNEEGETLRKLIPDAVEVKGNDSAEFKASKFSDFANGKIRVLITKVSIAGWGLNFQVCHNQIFASLDFSFEGTFQGIRRSWRFGQEYRVNIYLITTDTMQNVIDTLKRKEQQYETMQEEMSIAVNDTYTKKITSKMQKEVVTDLYALYHGDCIELIDKVEDNSIGFSIWSPPFKDLYVYSDNLEDMGNCKTDEEFDFAFQILVDKLYKKMCDGRNVAIHCMDLPIQKGKEGFIGLKDFSGEILRVMSKAGFIYHSRVTIWKNPVTEMQRTKALGLLHKQIKKDAAMSRVGIPDYLLIFRKPGEHENPVTHQDTDPTQPNYLPVDLWQKYASPVWMDIDYGNTLNGRDGRGEADERHIAPLQLETIERAIHLWSNEGDIIYTPFGGIGSEVYQAVKMKRRGILNELKQSYFEQAVDNIAEAAMAVKSKTLFDI